jgi:hypothetical protein
VSLLTVRAELAALIRAAVTADVVVHDYPVESTTIPAVVIVPADPYWVPKVFGDTPGMEVSIDLQLIVPRTEVSEGVDDLEGLGVVVGLAIKAAPVFRWQSMSGPEPIEVEQIPAIMSRVNVKTTA